MPPRTKRKQARQKNCEKARGSKRSRNSEGSSFGGLVSEGDADNEISLAQLAVTSDDALDTPLHLDAVTSDDAVDMLKCIKKL